MSKPKETKPYSYFDTPDGQDVWDKFLAVIKPTALVALGISTADVMLYSHPKGYLQTLGRYAYITAPILGAATVFVVTTNVLTNLRNQDDKLNWAAGGAAAGSVIGVWRRSPQIGFAAAGFLSLLAAGKKYAVQNNYTIIPEKRNVAHGGAKAVRHDWTLMSERPRNWTTGKDAE